MKLLVQINFLKRVYGKKNHSKTYPFFAILRKNVQKAEKSILKHEIKRYTLSFLQLYIYEI